MPALRVPDIPNKPFRISSYTSHLRHLPLFPANFQRFICSEHLDPLHINFLINKDPLLVELHFFISDHRIPNGHNSFFGRTKNRGSLYFERLNTMASTNSNIKIVFSFLKDIAGNLDLFGLLDYLHFLPSRLITPSSKIGGLSI